MKFQVGDIVVGNKLASEYYSIPKGGIILEVMHIDGEYFRGRLIEHSSGRGYSGMECEAFDLKEPMIQENE